MNETIYDEEQIKNHLPELDDLIKDIFKNDMLGGAWHCQEFLYKHGIDVDSVTGKVIIEHLKFRTLMMHFENTIWCCENKKVRAEAVETILRVFGKMAKCEAPLFYDEKQDMSPPSFREADIFNRGVDAVLMPLMNLSAVAPKYKLDDLLAQFVKTAKGFKVTAHQFKSPEKKKKRRKSTDE